LKQNTNASVFRIRAFLIKFDGYRALAIKSGGKVQLRSRNNNDFTLRYASIARALSGLPNESFVGGEVGVLDESGSIGESASRSTLNE
jgi:bifunctional non-homologous end joining protein LigD